MNAVTALAIALKKILDALSGITSTTFVPPDKIKFTTTSGATFELTIPNMHEHINMDVLDNFKIIDGNILHDDKIILTKENLINYLTSDGSIEINEDGEKIKLVSNISSGESGLSKDITSTVATGAIAVGQKLPKDSTLTYCMEKLLVKDLAPSVTISTTVPNTVLYEKGIAITPTLTVKVTKSQTTDGDINKITLSSSPNDANYDEVNNSPNASTNTITKSTSISNTTTYSATATNTKSKTGSKTFKYTFVNPTYYGVIPETLDETSLDEATIKSKTKELIDIANLSGKKDREVFTATKEKFFFCYDALYGNLTSIKDVANSIELITGCTGFDIDLTVADGSTVKYRCYIANDRGSYENASIDFTW